LTYWTFRWALILGSLALALPVAAVAGEFGTTSQASVSISITIPEHLQSRETTMGHDQRPPRSDRREFCFISNLPATYSVTLLPFGDFVTRTNDQGSLDAPAAITWSPGQGAPESQLQQGETIGGLNAGTAATCQDSAGGTAIIGVSRELSAHPPAGHNPVVLLIAAE
jgi:hypothetical protein